MDQQDKICIFIQETAKLLGIGLTSAYKLANIKDFYPAKRVCGRIVIHYELLEKWIEEQYSQMRQRLIEHNFASRDHIAPIQGYKKEVKILNDKEAKQLAVYLDNLDNPRWKIALLIALFM